MINSLKKFKNNPPIFHMLKIAIDDLKQVEFSPFRYNSDDEAIQKLIDNDIDLKKVQNYLKLNGYINESLDDFLEMKRIFILNKEVA